jgi:hypothetical protein
VFPLWLSDKTAPAWRRWFTPRNLDADPTFRKRPGGEAEDRDLGVLAGDDRQLRISTTAGGYDGRPGEQGVANEYLHFDVGLRRLQQCQQLPSAEADANA